MTVGAFTVEVACPHDVAEILELQRHNLLQNGGWLSAEFSAEWFTSVMAEMPIVLARDKAKVVGYLVSSPLSATAHVPVSQAKFVAYPPPPQSYNLGPICVEKDYRGRGLPRLMLDRLKKLLPGRIGIGFVRADNAASLAAHIKLGLRNVASFTNAGINYFVLIC